ncbi:DUF4159 domain-containing protein [Aureimonas jatrophae]|uniref:N-terminal double-transmembrane domain-containing protein n=1 Tax=Aureimonas jatrophae TaxID=1166073 RepID=A0A1H0EMW1_9HYPH|nr:DUF4159 domain-containing protein [Aureimonas jatrophae]MBB3950420.1 hypothetical protein [Aureimonas jatrophae]SDN83653.1 N-terminal double-transmembrane domain-containing protein [Aureimonas jatrophae]
MGALSFGAPLVLVGLLALPAIWWLLRLTPPRPQTEAFPPLRILERVLKREETPARSPWWLTVLRLLLALLVILALAAPILNPREDALAAGEGPVVVMLDNGWAGAERFAERREAAAGLIREAGQRGRPVSLLLTAEGADNDPAPVEAATALERLQAAEPRPVPTRREAAAERLAALPALEGASLALLTDGLDTSDTAAATERLRSLNLTGALLYRAGLESTVGLTAAANGTEALTVSGIRPEGSVAAPLSVPLRALDRQEREIGRADLVFAAGSTAGEARFAVPVELRNDIARIEREGLGNAAGVRLVDDSFRRRKVGLVSGEAADIAQPLLSPLYYITRALEPYADLARAQSADLATAIPQLVAERPSIIVLADIGVMPEAATEALDTFVENGGTLVRFAGPRLAASTAEDTLVPVRLRGGERQLGGALSWSEPQRLAPMTAGTPFAGIAVPADVTVSRQILAEPSAELASRTWASLADGTPIVTAAARGAGTIVLFHTTAEATWSNLPISGAFVDMLRRVVTLSRGGVGASGDAPQTLPPYRVMDGTGRLVAPGPEVRPIEIAAGAPAPAASLENPPGLYGTADGYSALNLLASDAVLRPLPPLDLGVPLTERAYGLGDATDLTPWLFAGAILLFALDALALLWMNGGAGRLRARLRRGGAATALPTVLLAAVLVLHAGSVLAQAPPAPPTAADPGAATRGLEGIDAEAAIRATETTHLAYVETGEEATDRISRQGLSGLSQYIASKTALEPGEPAAVDIARDELSFYPILYWPVHASAPMPSPEAISRVDAYMKGGGTVLFDVEGDAMGDLAGTTVSAGQRRLRDILADLDIPPLEPVPRDHVLTKAFYIMDSFPGRHSGSDLWVESLQRQADAEARPASAGDGVSSIMITSNDFASAWAVDDTGLFVFPTDSADPSQREWSYRAGVNIVMYVLTGNYKADQVHVPALLERLGQ